MREGGGVMSQAVQTVVDGPAGCLDEAVGVQQQCAAGWQLNRGVGAAHADSRPQQQTVPVGEVLGQAVTGDEQRRGCPALDQVSCQVPSLVRETRAQTRVAIETSVIGMIASSRRSTIRLGGVCWDHA